MAAAGDGGVAAAAAAAAGDNGGEVKGPGPSPKRPRSSTPSPERDARDDGARDGGGGAAAAAAGELAEGFASLDDAKDIPRIEPMYELRFPPTWNGEPGASHMKPASEANVLRRYVKEYWRESRRLSTREKVRMLRDLIKQQGHDDYASFSPAPFNPPENFSRDVDNAPSANLRKAVKFAVHTVPAALKGLTDVMLMVAAIGSSVEDGGLQGQLGNVVQLLSDIGLQAAESTSQFVGLALDRHVALATKPGTRAPDTMLGGTQLDRDEEWSKLQKKTDTVAKRARTHSSSSTGGHHSSGKKKWSGKKKHHKSNWRPPASGGGGGGGGGGSAAAGDRRQNSRSGGTNVRRS